MMRAHAISNFDCIFLLDRDHCTNLSPGLCIILLLCASAFGDSTNKQKTISTKRTPYKALANHQQPPHHLIKRTPPLLSLCLFQVEVCVVFRQFRLCSTRRWSCQHDLKPYVFLITIWRKNWLHGKQTIRSSGSFIFSWQHTITMHACWKP